MFAADENETKIKQLQQAFESIPHGAPKGGPEWLAVIAALSELEAQEREPLAEKIAERFGICKEEVFLALEHKGKTVPLEQRIQAVGQHPEPDVLRALCADIAARDPLEHEWLISLLAKVSGNKKRVLEQTVQDERRKLSNGDPQTTPQGRRVGDVIVDAPLPDLELPYRYAVHPTTGAIARTSETEASPVSPVPVLVTRRLVDVDEGSVKIELSYRRNGMWRSTTAPRATVADTRKILTLADEDLAVTSDNARELIRYLAEFEQKNIYRLPTSRTTRSLGWRDLDGKRIFLWGNTALTYDSGSSDALSVEPEGAGERQALQGLVQGGTWDAWVERVFGVAYPFPRLRLGIYAALSAPLLSIVSAPGFVLHYGNSTTGGKTTAAQVAASVAGYPGGPQLTTRDGLIQQWDGTAVSGERLFAFLRHLPAFLDDTHRVDARIVAQTVYAAVNGQGRRRGALRGSQRIATWHLCLISTGETTLAESTRMGGIQVRGIDSWGDALETGDPRFRNKEDRGKVAQLLRSTVGIHYGHALPRFVNALLAMEPTKIVDVYTKANQEIIDRIGASRLGDLGGRLAGAFAAILTSAELFHRRVGVGTWMGQIPYTDLLDFVVWEFARVLDMNTPRHTDVVAYDAVMSWAGANRASFHGGDADARQPYDGWFGVWEVKLRGEPGESFLAIEPGRLRAFLSRNEYPVEAVLRAWRDRGMLVPDSKGQQLTRIVRYGDTLSRAIVLRRAKELTVSYQEESEEQRF